MTGYQFHINNFIYSPVNIKYRNQIQLNEYTSCTRWLTYLRGGSRVSISSQGKDGESFSFVGGKGAATRRLGFQVVLRICLVFPVKISSHQSPVLPFPPWKAIKPEPRRRLMAEILPLKSPRTNVTIAWLSSGNTFDLLISPSCFFVRLPLVINNLHLVENGREGLKLGWFTFPQTTRVEIFCTNVKLLKIKI